MVRSSRLSEQEPVRDTIFLQSHQLLFTVRHTSPPSDFPESTVLSMRWTEKVFAGWMA